MDAVQRPDKAQPPQMFTADGAQVAERMEAVLTPEGAQIVIRLDLKAIQALQLDVNSVSVAQAIAAGKLHLKMEHIMCGPHACLSARMCSELNGSLHYSRKMAVGKLHLKSISEPAQAIRQAKQPI